MTVWEHLSLIGQLKASEKSKVSKAIEETIEMTMLTEYRNKKARELSGGVKRKLSIAMALVNKPKLIILDEPTSGLDAHSRK